MRYLAVMLVLALAGAGCGRAPANAEREASGGEARESGQAPERTTIGAAAAAAAGIRVQTAGPGQIQETLDLIGRVALQPAARAEVRAPYPGAVRAVTKNIGDHVRRGEVLARVESAESLQVYSVVSPIAGVVLERGANIGELSADRALFIVGDLSRLQAELNVFPRDAERVRAGQPVIITGLDGAARVEGRLATLLPFADGGGQTLIARAPFSASSDFLRPGMSVRGSVVLAVQPAPLVVTAGALQRMGGADVVFVRQGETYFARPVQIGRRSRNWIEVTSGLRAGEIYVSENAFIIKADIEKSGESD